MRQLNHQTFARVLQNLGEHGSFRNTIDGTPVNSEKHLVARISNIAARIWETPVFSNMSSNPCRIGVVCAYMPMTAISNASWDAFESYFQFIVVFLFL
ncbi:hypothetical protein TNCV_1029101 [Trichonephila clavipes]|nr:hypothetical protein TNCV_1029101 [Trichonephila clavipes]